MSTSATTRTTCPYCGVGCGVLATPQRDGSVAVRGDPAHPANRGKLCVKGSALGDTLGLQDRLLHPVVRGERVSWDSAIATVAEGFKRIMAEHGPESVAFYVSGQLLTEDYYVANKLMKGYVGAANIDTNSRLCMASAVAGHKRAFGEDVVPVSYEDLDLCDLVVLVGSNTAWCHPIILQRLTAAREKRGTRFVVLDPRRTATRSRWTAVTNHVGRKRSPAQSNQRASFSVLRPIDKPSLTLYARVFLPSSWPRRAGHQRRFEPAAAADGGA